MNTHAPRLAIIAFCLWHMFATAVYVIPDQAADRISSTVRDTFTPVVRPYVLITSQWQKWDIFSPDPLRRVSSYHIEIERAGTWGTIRDIRFSSLPWWNRAKELKILRRVEEYGEHSGGAYLAFVCRQRLAPAGAHLRLRIAYHVLPTGEELRRMEGWTHYEPTHHEYVLAHYYCPLSA